MDKPCCVGVVRDPNGLKGNESSLGDLPLYTTAPKEANGVGVLVIHDIFGFSIPNTKYVVDHLAENGFTAVMPDFYRGKPWPEDKELGGDEFGAWFGGIVSPDFWAKFDEDVKKVVDHLKANGCNKVHVMGFCWGGRASANCARTGLFSSAVSLHGVMHGAEDVNESKCPIAFITVPGDSYFPEDKHEECKKALESSGKAGFVKVFDSMYHGFVVRGDFANNKEVKNASEQALKDTCEFFKTHSA